MKPKKSRRFTQWAAFTVIAAGLTTEVFATPQIAPRGESEVTEFIRMDLSSDKKLQATDIQVRLKDRIAILTGTTRSLGQAERAAARVIASEGVRAVVNQIEVTPAADVLPAIQSALHDQKMIRSDEVRISVSGNRVSLTGKVGTWDEKDLARELVSEVSGVGVIENHLIITFEGVREDAQIEEQLRFIIADDPLYEGLDLVAKVESGVVRLGGKVGNRGEHDRLIRRSYVTGVVDVTISDLSIDSDLAMEGLADKDYTSEDSLAALRAALGADLRINAKTVRAAMENGTITLTGKVARIEERDAIESTARGIPGVLRVANELRINAKSTTEFKAASPPLVKRSR